MSSVLVNGGKLSPEGISETTYGFIGIGVMGYGMAANLRKKLPQSSNLIICEVNQERREKFFAEQQGLLEVAQSPRELAEKAVSDLSSKVESAANMSSRMSLSQCYQRVNMFERYSQIRRRDSYQPRKTILGRYSSNARQLKSPLLSKYENR